MLNKATKTIALSAALAGLAGCVSMNAARGPGAQQMGMAQKVVYARVRRIQDTRVNVNRHQLLATGAGAAAGGILGSLIGGGRGKTLAEMAGVFAGGAAGHQLGKGTVRAVRLTLQTQNGGQYAVLEPAGKYNYHIGERVEVVGSGNRLQVIPVHDYGRRGNSGYGRQNQRNNGYGQRGYNNGQQ